MQPDALVTLEEARLIWREVPAATWRKWAERERIEPNSWNERGTPVYRVRDLAAVVEQRSREPRGGNRCA